jgi:hypothetical protein
MEVKYVSRSDTKGFLKLLRVVFGGMFGFCAIGVWQFNSRLHEDRSDRQQTQDLRLELGALGLGIAALTIEETCSHFLKSSGGIRADSNGNRIVTLKRLRSVPEKGMLLAALDLRKRLNSDSVAQEAFLAERAKILEQLSSLQADSNLRSWVANQIAALRCFVILGISPDRAMGRSVTKEEKQEAVSRAFAEGSLDHFEKRFPSFKNVGPVGDEEWCIAGGTEYVLTTERLLVLDKQNRTWSVVHLNEVTALTVLT